MKKSDCNCKLCGLKIGEKEFSNLTPRQIQVRLKTKYQISMSLSEIESHLNFFHLEFKKEQNPPKNSIVQKTVFETVLGEKNHSLVDLDDLDFSTYKNLDINSPNSIVVYIQKIQLYLYLQQCEIVVSKIHAYKRGELNRYPTLAITNLVRLYGLLNAVTGISVYSNQQSALQTVESMGFQLESSRERDL